MAAESETPGFEPAEISRPWLVAGSVFGFFVIVIAMMGALLAIYVQVAPMPTAPETFPKPELQPHPRAYLKKYIEAQKKRLNQIGWIDKSAGVAAIPIDNAMRIIAGRGTAAFAPVPEASGDKPQGGPTP
jgi:hypothetical protein